MPTMANITVKKADGTTDVIYTAVAGSSGDKTPAIWRNQTVGTTPSEYPTLTLTSRSNGPGTARRVDFSYTWPTTSQDAGGNKVVDGRANFSGSYLVPQNQTQGVIQEQVYQACNLIASALVKSCIAEGFAPR